MHYDLTASWIGLILSFVAAFGFSLYHISLSDLSKISLSRFLEDHKKPYRQTVLQRYEEIKIAVDLWRTLFILVFFVYLLMGIRGISARPLYFLLAALVGTILVFDALPRLLTGLFPDAFLSIFLPSYRLVLWLSTPAILLSRWLCRREENEPETQEERDRETSDQEINTFIDEAKEEGIIEKGEDELLRSVVTFGDTVAREVMTPRLDMIAIRRDATMHKLRKLIVTEKYSRIPVYRDRLDNVEGVVMAKDLLTFSEAEHDRDSIEPLIRPALFVAESMKLDDLFKELQKAKQKMAIVIDEHGGVSGLVTMEDLVEEIFGEIQDEYDTEEAQIVQNGPDDYTVSGDAKVEELEDIFEMELADDDYITTSGLLIHELGRLPARGESHAVKNLVFEVLDVDQRRIKKLRVRKPEETPATDA